MTEDSVADRAESGEIGDELDFEIINALQARPRATYSTLSRMMDVSESTIRRRMNALFKQGRLRVMAIPDPTINGFPSSAMIMIRTDAGATASVVEVIREMWQTTYVGEIIGIFSISCIVREESTQALAHLIHEQIESIPGVLQVDAHVVSDVKKGWGEWKLPVHKSPKQET